MGNHYVLIGVAAATFFAGTGIGYTIFTNTYNPDMTFQNPQMTNSWMNTMMQNQQFMQAMMSNPQFQQQYMGPWMMQNPQLMQNMMIQSPDHIPQMAKAMKENHEFMQEMMSAIIDDPTLRLQMLGHM